MKPSSHNIENDRSVQMERSGIVDRVHLRFVTLAAIIGIACLLIACNPSAPGTGIRWTNYPDLNATPKLYDWLVLKCQYSDVSTIPTGLDTDISQFLGLAGAGYGNMVDYFHDVSYNGASVFAGAFVGWVAAPFKLTDVTAAPPHQGRLWGPGQRAERVKECLQSIPSNQEPDFSRYYGVVMVTNVRSDGGACYDGPASMKTNSGNYNLACVVFDPDSLWTAFAVEEIGHGLGMGHSFDNTQNNCGGGPGEYCDPWDSMSALGTFKFSTPNWLNFSDGSTGAGGPGMVTPNLLNRGWLPSTNQASYTGTTEQTYILHALSHAQPGTLLVVVMNNIQGATYTVEYRQADGWDQSFASDPNVPATVKQQGGAVLVHKFNANGNFSSNLPVATLIETTQRGASGACDRLVLALPYGYVTVDSIDRANAVATVSVGGGYPPFEPPCQGQSSQQVRVLPTATEQTRTLLPQPRPPIALQPTATRSQAPRSPILVAPIDGAAVDCGRVNLTWKPAEDPSGIRDYDIELEKLLDRSYVSEKTWNNVRDLSAAFEGTCDTHYRWRARATDNAGKQSDWSRYGYFRVKASVSPAATPTRAPAPRDTTAPQPPIQTAPIDGATVNCGQVTLMWKPATDPSGIRDYDVELEKLVDRTYVADKTLNNVRGDSVSIDPTCNMHYRWRVRATDNAGNQGSWSEFQDFDVQSQIQ